MMGDLEAGPTIEVHLDAHDYFPCGVSCCLLFCPATFRGAFLIQFVQDEAEVKNNRPMVDFSKL